MIRVGKSKYGRGVFATKNISKSTRLHKAPVLIIPKNQRLLIAKTDLVDYVFDWDNGQYMLALGYGSLFNHSFSPNAVTEADENFLYFIAKRDIIKGEELFINYGYQPES